MIKLIKRDFGRNAWAKDQFDSLEKDCSDCLLTQKLMWSEENTYSFCFENVVALKRAVGVAVEQGGGWSKGKGGVAVEQGKRWKVMIRQISRVEADNVNHFSCLKMWWP